MIRIAKVFMLMIVVSFWIVLPMSAGAGPDRFAQSHPTTDSKNKQTSPNLQHSRPAPSAHGGAPAVKSASSSSSRKQSGKPATHVKSHSTASSNKVKSASSSSSHKQSGKPSTHVKSHSTASSNKGKSASSSSSQRQSEKPSTHVKSHSTSDADKRLQPFKASADPAKANSTGTPAKTGGATAGSPAKAERATSGTGTTAPEVDHNRTAGATPGSGSTGPEAHHPPESGVPGASGSVPQAEPQRVPWQTIPPLPYPQSVEEDMKSDPYLARELENKAEGFREAAKKRAQVAVDMEAKRESVNGKITLEHIKKTTTFADAGGYRSKDFYDSPPYVQAEVNRFEGWTASNIYQTLSLVWTRLAHGEEAWCSSWWQGEIDRSKTIAQDLNNKAQQLQAQADNLRKGSTQSSPASTGTQ
jgi:hypothetical protein